MVPGAETEWRGKDIAFVGDKTPFQNPQPVMLSRDKPWKWVSKLVENDAIALAMHYAGGKNMGRLWNPQTTPIEALLAYPWLLLLPHMLVQFCVVQQQMPHELHAHISSLINKQDPPFQYIEVEGLLQWCMMAAQEESPGKKHSQHFLRNSNNCQPKISSMGTSEDCIDIGM